MMLDEAWAFNEELYRLQQSLSDFEDVTIGKAFWVLCAVAVLR